MYYDGDKGMLTPATLADINGDSVSDIILASYADRVVAIDGSSFLPIWNASFDGCETYAPPAPGHFDDDGVVDFAVTYQCGGQGYPVYEYSRTVVLSGATGEQLAQLPQTALGPESAPITLAMAGVNNDAFLQWRAHCKGHEDKRLHYSFPDCELGFYCTVQSDASSSTGV